MTTTTAVNDDRLRENASECFCNKKRLFHFVQVRKNKQPIIIEIINFY